MLGRSFEVKMVKTPKKKQGLSSAGAVIEVSEDDEEFVYKLELVQEFIRDMVLDGAKLFAAYMVLDTWRKVTIVKAARIYTKS